MGPTIDPTPPVRSCLGCRRRLPTHDLVRITRDVDAGRSGFTVGGASSGRGAWLCRDDAECVEQAMRTKQFERAWKTRLGDDERDELRRALDRHHEQQRTDER